MTFTAIPVGRIHEPTIEHLPAPIEQVSDVFVIEPDIRVYRYLLTGGMILDVSTPNRNDSNDRTKVLDECSRRWGKREWRIEGIAEVRK